jgi:short-subunit dehydrogenase
MRLAGAVALVTGASSGIGAATATALSAAGARLLVTGRDPARLAAVAARTGAAAIPADLAADGGPDRVAAAALAAAGRVDLLVCNAGAGWAGPISELPAATAAELVRLNLLVPIQLARLLVPSMTERGSGRLIFVSSIAGVTGVRNEAVYAATKSGLIAFTRAAFTEMRKSGLKLAVIVPGLVDTAMIPNNKRLDRAAMLSTSDVAHAVMQIVNSPARSCAVEVTLEPHLDPERPR